MAKRVMISRGEEEKLRYLEEGCILVLCTSLLYVCSCCGKKNKEFEARSMKIKTGKREEKEDICKR